MTNMIALSGYQTPAMESVGKVATVDADGPAAINNNFTGAGSIGFPVEVMIACTWNQDLAQQYGEMMGKMCREMNIAGWYAPGMNTHRTPFGARNYEYFSEDGTLAGYISSATVKGAASQGVYVYIKHFRRGSQVMLDVDGESMDVLLKEINFNPLKGQVDEIDFQALVKGEKVQSVAEVILENHDKVASGVLQLLLEEVPYRALPGDLIEKVMVDVGNLKVGDSIKVGDLDMAKNEKVDLLIDPETIIVTVSESRNAVEEDTGEEAEGGEA